MQPEKPFRSHAFCKPRYLDGQGDDALGKEPAWKGTVASRIRSLNDMANPARTGQAPTRPAQDVREEATQSTRPMVASSLTPMPSDESHGSGGLSGRTNPFVRRSPPRTLPTPSTPSKPSLPQRISHSNVPVRAPVPSVLVQRPTFFEDQNQATQQPTAREARSPDLDIESCRAFGCQPIGNRSRSAEPTSPALSAGTNLARTPSPTGAYAAAKRFEELESRRWTTASGLERDTKADTVMVDQNPRAQLTVASPSIITARKSQPELRSKDKFMPSVPETERSSRPGLTTQKASLPDNVRSTSPSIGIRSRIAPFERAERVCSVSPNESGQAKADRTGGNHARLEGIETMIQDIETTSTNIESTAREIRAAAHVIGVLSSPSAITTNEARAIGSSVSGAEPQPQVKMQAQTLQADVSSSAACMRRNTKGHTPSEDAYGASSAPAVIDPIDSILAEHNAVVDHVIEQLRVCGEKLQTIRNLSQQFGSISVPSSSAVDKEDASSDSALLPNAAQASVVSRAPSVSINDPPALQIRRTRSITDLVHLVDDDGESRGLKLKQAEGQQLKDMAEVRCVDAEHESHAFLAGLDPISPAELQRMLSRKFASSPAEHPVTLVSSTPRGRPHLSPRDLNDTTLPRNDIVGSARTSTPTPPPTPPQPHEYLPTERPMIRMGTTLPIPTTPPSPHSEEYGSPLQGKTSNPCSPHAWSATRSSPVRRRYHRQPSSYLSAKRGIDSSTDWAGLPTASVLDSLRPAPTVYFPYQHLPSARAAAPPASDAHKEFQQGGFCPLFQTQRDDPRGPIIRAPETPPPPPPLFSVNPEVGLGLSGDGFSPPVPPEPIDYRPSSTDMARAAARAALELEHEQLTKLTAHIMPIPLVDQRPAATSIPREDTKVLLAAPSSTESARSDNSPPVLKRKPTWSTRSSALRRPLYVQQERFFPSEKASISPQRSEPPPRRTATIQRVQSPTLSLPASTLSPSREATPSLHHPSQPQTSLPQPSITFTLSPHDPFPFDLESPLFIRPSPSHSPTTMAAIAAADHSHTTNRHVLPEPAPLDYPLPSPTGPLPHPVHRLTSSPNMAPTAVATVATKNDSVDDNNDDDDCTPTAAGTMTAKPEQRQHEQDQAALANLAFLNSPPLSTPPNMATLPPPIIAIQQPYSDASVPASRTASTSSSVYSGSPLVLSPQQPPRSLQQGDSAGCERSDQDDGCSASSRLQPPVSEKEESLPDSTTTTQETESESEAPRQPCDDAPSSSSSCYHHHMHRHYYHCYQPLNVSDRVRMLEDARKERMRILRATGQHWAFLRAFSGDCGLEGSAAEAAVEAAGVDEGKEVSDGARELMLLLGGPREQIGALKAPWW